MNFEELSNKHITKSNLVIAMIISNSLSELYQNTEMLKWLGSNLTGVHPIRYYEAPRNALIYSLGVDSGELTRDLLNVKGFNKDWVISSDPFAVSLIMVAHKVSNSGYSDKDMVLKNIHKLLSLKYITTLYSRYYINPVSETVARGVYDSLPISAYIKKYGSNFMVIEHRSDAMLGADYITRIKSKAGVDKVKLINNIYRVNVKSIQSIFKHKLNIDANKNKRSVMLSDADNQIEVVSDIGSYHNAFKSLILGNMYDLRLVEIMEDITTSMDSGKLKIFLEHLSADYIRDRTTINGFMDDLIGGSIHYLKTHDRYPPYDVSLGTTIKYMLVYWSNSRLVEPRLVRVKAYIHDTLLKHSVSRNHRTVRAWANTFGIYLFILVVLKRE